MHSATLHQIHPKAFSHPLDEAATNALSQVPFLPDLLKKIAKLNIEERFHAFQMYNSIRVGPTQFGELWNLVNDVANRFGMPHPTTYVARTGSANAFAFGLHNHSIVLTTQLVDMMEEPELEAIIAHELAHILCEHMLYRNVGLALTAQGIAPLLKLAPRAVNLLVTGAFSRWSQAAEYSADRAALLVLQKPEALVACLARLAGVPRKFVDEFDPRQFAAQAKEYEDNATTWSKIVTWDMGLQDSHPEPANRARAILDWSESEDYQDILEGRFPRRLDVEREGMIRIKGLATCPLCMNPAGESEICSVCGLPQEASRQRLCPENHPVSIDWKHCKICGKPAA